MSQPKSINTVKFQTTIDENTHRVIEDMVALGILGTTKSEVGASIIRNWLWNNQEKLRENGIFLVGSSNSKK